MEKEEEDRMNEERYRALIFIYVVISYVYALTLFFYVMIL